MDDENVALRGYYRYPLSVMREERQGEASKTINGPGFSGAPSPPPPPMLFRPMGGTLASQLDQWEVRGGARAIGEISTMDSLDMYCRVASGGHAN